MYLGKGKELYLMTKNGAQGRATGGSLFEVTSITCEHQNRAEDVLQDVV